MPVGDGGRTVYSLRLIKGGRIGTGGGTVETIPVERRGADRKTQLPISIVFFLHEMEFAVRQLDFDGPAQRRPNDKFGSGRGIPGADLL